MLSAAVVYAIPSLELAHASDTLPGHALPCSPVPTLPCHRPSWQAHRTKPQPNPFFTIGSHFSEKPERTRASSDPRMIPKHLGMPTRAPTGLPMPLSIPTASLHRRLLRLRRALPSSTSNAVLPARRCDLLPRALGSTTGRPRVHSNPAEPLSLPFATLQTPCRCPSASCVGRHVCASALVPNLPFSFPESPSSSLGLLRAPWWRLAAVGLPTAGRRGRRRREEEQGG